jgi:hypothetical protein
MQYAVYRVSDGHVFFVLSSEPLAVASGCAFIEVPANTHPNRIKVIGGAIVPI